MFSPETLKTRDILAPSIKPGAVQGLSYADHPILQGAIPVKTRSFRQRKRRAFQCLIYFCGRPIRTLSPLALIK